MMYQSRRIVSNTIANWVRGIVALFLGLFSCRWALQAFGSEGYGLWTLCCSASMIALSFHSMIGMSTQRFLSVAAGGKGDSDDVSLCSWRRVAAKTHLIAALLTVAFSAPILVGYFGAISGVPKEMSDDCLLVVVALLVQGFVMMINTSNRQLFIAHQSMVEPAIWGLLCVVINFSVLYWMVAHPGRWLVRYVFFMAAVNVLIEVCMGLRARCLFDHAFKRDAGEVNTKEMARKLVKFAGWRFVADCGNILGAHGLNILVSRLLGAGVAGGVGIARSMVWQHPETCPAYIPDEEFAYGR